MRFTSRSSPSRVSFRLGHGQRFEIDEMDVVMSSWLDSVTRWSPLPRIPADVS